jgi:hypothetical protein
MSALLLSEDERGVVIFRIWQSLRYVPRMILSLSLVAVGILLQCAGAPPLAGFILILGGNLLLLVKGYDNRVKLDAYSPDSAWETVEPGKLTEFAVLQRRVIAWDRSLLDISNPLGAVAFIGVLLFLFVLLRVTVSDRFLFILGVDAVLLLAPHWLSGMRRVSLLMKPALNVKIEALLALVRTVQAEVARDGWEIVTYAQLSGGDARVPQDVKLKIAPPEPPADFLGFYVQVVTNNVQGRDYPYVYTVVVAKQGYGLKPVADRFRPGPKQTREFEAKRDVEYIVLRQTTTKRSGYHTKPGTAATIFRSGLALAKQAVDRDGEG